MTAADPLPNPSGPPEPPSEPLMNVIELPAMVGMLAISAGLVFLVPGMFVSHCCKGATRSARIHWNERQVQIQQAVTESGALENPAHENEPGQS